jgi:hypothetical protein
MHTLEQLQSGALDGIRRLDLSCGLRAVPPDVFRLADTLEVLNLSGNQLTSLPPDLPRLHRLKVIFCSDNPFTELPTVLGDCAALQVVGFKACHIVDVHGSALPRALRWLILTDNAIAQLPSELGQRPSLQKLMLAGNRLCALPAGLADARNLELIRLAANHLAELPDWLTKLPRLGWLALSGNPMGWQRSSASALPTVSWPHLQVEGLLGEGASGRIYRVQWPGTAGQAALKLFKGAITSDGLPAHELAACVAAGQHPSLCTPLAQLVDHPQGAQGLLFPLIPPEFINLAAAPSLDSCTRDVYPAGLCIPVPVAVRLVRDVAAAVAYLHQRGVVHGDLYAHNILWNPVTGKALLSDFGAATQLPAGCDTLQDSLQALEVWAFGCLLDEIATYAASDLLSDEAYPGVRNALATLAQHCMNPKPANRPPMTAVNHHLEGLSEQLGNANR